MKSLTNQLTEMARKQAEQQCLSILMLLFKKRKIFLSMVTSQVSEFSYSYLQNNFLISSIADSCAFFLLFTCFNRILRTFFINTVLYISHPILSFLMCLKMLCKRGPEHVDAYHKCACAFKGQKVLDLQEIDMDMYEIEVIGKRR